MMGIVLYYLLFLVFAFRHEKLALRALKYSEGIGAGDPHWKVFPSVSLIKPVKGADEYSEECFRSWLTQEYPAKVQIIFSLQDQSDPAIEILNRLKKEYQFEVIVNPVMKTFSGKMSNLVFGEKHAQNEVLVFSDSDIIALPGALKRIVSRLKEKSIVSCLPRHILATNIWGRIYSAAWNELLLMKWGPQMFQCKSTAISGGTFALTQSTLNQLGGFSKFKNYIAEDVAIGREATTHGISLLLGPLVESPVGSLPWNILFQKLVRFHQIGLYMNPKGIKATLFDFLILFGYLPIVLYGILNQQYLILFSTLCFLIVKSRIIGKITAQGQSWYFFEMFLSDCIRVSSIMVAIFSRTVEWGGIKYSISKEGKLDW